MTKTLFTGDSQYVFKQEKTFLPLRQKSIFTCITSDSFSVTCSPRRSARNSWSSLYRCWDCEPFELESGLLCCCWCLFFSFTLLLFRLTAEEFLLLNMPEILRPRLMGEKRFLKLDKTCWEKPFLKLDKTFLAWIRKTFLKHEKTFRTWREMRKTSYGWCRCSYEPKRLRCA